MDDKSRNNPKREKKWEGTKRGQNKVESSSFPSGPTRVKSSEIAARVTTDLEFKKNMTLNLREIFNMY